MDFEKLWRSVMFRTQTRAEENRSKLARSRDPNPKWRQSELRSSFSRRFARLSEWVKTKSKMSSARLAALRRVCEHRGQIWILLHHLPACKLAVLKCTKTIKQLWETFDPESLVCHQLKRGPNTVCFYDMQWGATFRENRSLHIMLQQLYYLSPFIVSRMFSKFSQI